jgi:hypothetical protein
VCAAWLVSGWAWTAVASAQAPAAADPAQSATDLVLEPSPDPEWSVQVEPSFWYVTPSGDVTLPASSGTGGFTTPGDSVPVGRLNLDSPRFEPAGEIHLSGGRWRMTFSGATFSLERDGAIADSSFRLGSVEVSPGDPMDVKMDFTTVELTGGYLIWGRVFSSGAHTQQPQKAVKSLARVYLMGGGRFYDVGFDFARTTAVQATAEADEFFGEPIVGVRAEVELARDFTLDVQVTGGGLPAGDSTSYSVDVQAGFLWRPHPNVGVQIGYRQLAYWLSDGEGEDEFEYDGRLAGLFAGLVIRF